MTHAPQTRERAIAAYVAKVPMPLIEESVGVARSVIYRWLREGAKIRRYKPSERRKLHPDVLRAMHAAGKSDGAISREVGVSSAAVRKARRKLGLAPNFASGWQAAGPGRPGTYLHDIPKMVKLHALGFGDYEIAKLMHVTFRAVQRAREKQELERNYHTRWKTRAGKIYGAALALMLLASGAQAQGTGWQGHPTGPDPFMNMKTGDGRSCCSAVDCAYTDDCVTAGKNEPGVIGPDGQCHALTEAALKTKNCAPGGTSACFYKGQMLCACTSGT